MPNSNVLKIARVLNILVIVALVCNLILLFFVPVAVWSDSPGLLAGVGDYFHGILYPGEDDVAAAGIAASFLAWFWIASLPPDKIILTLFLLFSGACTAVILWQGRRVLATIRGGTPFSMENAVSLRRAAIASFLISGAALVRAVFSVCYYHSPAPLLSYNALFVPIFAMAGLLCLVMSALFRQAAEMKAENDLTI